MCSVAKANKQVMNTPFLDFYFSCMETGRMPGDGLCECITIPEEILPTESDMDYMIENGLSESFWASGLGKHDWNRSTEFTPLRQTIVLLCAAILGEKIQKRHEKNR